MERTVFTGGAVFDATGTDPVPGEGVVDGDRIVEVRSGWREDHGTARVVNIAGRTIMPGLIESHAHLTFPSAVGHIDPSFNPPLDVSFFHHIEGMEAELARAERNAGILLDAGFTSAYSARSLLPVPGEVILRDKIRPAAVRGPRLRAASAERDNHPLRPDGHFVADWQGPDACRQYVVENAAQGFDSVKFLLSNDDVFVPGGSQITQYSFQEAQAAGEQARESGVWLNCHAQSAESVKLAVRAGFRSIYHCTYADEEALEAMTEIYPEIRSRGIRALPGGDYGFPNNPIGRNARDLQLFVDLLGYSPVEVLTAATRLGGQLMGMGDELGLLAPGYLADLLVVRGNPAQDVTLLQDAANLEWIVQGGRPHKQPELTRPAERQPAEPPVTSRANATT